MRPAAVAVLDATTGIPSMIHDVQTIFSGNASTMDKVMAGADLLLNVVMDVSMVVGVGEGLRAAYVGAKVAGHVAVEVGEHVAEHAGEDAVEHVAEHEAEDAAEHAAEDDAEHVAESCAMSFAPDTLVATANGTQTPIVALKVGDKVLAYDPQTGTAGVQTVEHTFINHDVNLLDVTLRVTSSAHAIAGQAPATTRTAASKPQGQAGTQAAATGTSTTIRDEVVHTTANHPWYTADHGWLPASFLHLGEPVVRVDGTAATVVAIRTVPGAASMWDLTVSNVHTFAVGAGAYVVHNCPDTNDGAK